MLKVWFIQYGLCYKNYVKNKYKYHIIDLNRSLPGQFCELHMTSGCQDSSLIKVNYGIKEFEIKLHGLLTSHNGKVIFSLQSYIPLYL